MRTVRHFWQQIQNPIQNLLDDTEFQGMIQNLVTSAAPKKKVLTPIEIRLCDVPPQGLEP